MTDTEVIILGLVAEGIGYGYRIEQEIEARHLRRWTDIGFSSIYYLLAKLERQGLVASLNETSPEGPNRRVYRVTGVGRKTLAQEAARRIAALLPLPASKYVGLSLIPHLEPEVLKRALAAHAAKIEARLTTLAANRRGDYPWFAGATFELGARLAETEREWLKAFREKIKEGCQDGRTHRN